MALSASRLLGVYFCLAAVLCEFIASIAIACAHAAARAAVQRGQN